MKGRSMTLQLTPLLDMMLIIIFAQYIEMADKEDQQKLEASARVVAVQQELSQSRDDLREMLTAYEEVSRELAARLRELNTAKDQAAKSHNAAEHYRQQRDTVAELMPELFDLSDDAIQQLIKTRAPENTRLTPEQIERLRREFKKLADKKPEAALRHLLTFDEMRKRCDLWQLYVTDSGVAILNADRHTHRFRANTADEFEAELFQRYKLLPESKSLVIILVSHGDLSAGAYEALTDGLPRATRRMAQDVAGRTRFEYGVLGFTNDPPVPVK
jgi:myosin heavy subunit